MLLFIFMFTFVVVVVVVEFFVLFSRTLIQFLL